MRPIENHHLSRLANLGQLRVFNQQIVDIPEGQKGTFIDSHDSACSALRGALWALGHAKCWYSEVSLQECEGQVEHYRPKKRLHGAIHDGYWWRAFDSNNLRLAHPTVNRRKTDYLTGKRAGKGSYFPIRNEANRAKNAQDELQEEPVLLDPVIALDTRLICFSEESGAPRPRYSKQVNEWLNQRAEDSISYYHLDEGTWNAKRADLMATVRKLCVQLEELAVAVPKDQQAYDHKIDEIIKFISPFSEFSSACLQVVRDKALLGHFATGL